MLRFRGKMLRMRVRLESADLMGMPLPTPVFTSATMTLITYIMLLH
jgi:hypothetical protein